MLRRSALGVVLPLVACGFAGGWFAATWLGAGAGSAGAESDEEGGAAVPPEQMSVKVTTAPVVAGDLPVEVSAFGTVRAAPSAVATLTTRASGRVLTTPVVPGQTVQKGEVVVQLDPAPLQVAVAEAQGRLAAAERAVRDFESTGREQQHATLQASAQQAAAAAELARTDLERLQPLAKDQLVAARRLTEAEQALATATAERDRAQSALAAFESGGAKRQQAELEATRSAAAAQLEQSQRDLAAAAVAAPADGTLTALQVQPGDQVAAGAALGSVLVGSGRRLEFDVMPDVAARLHEGAAAHWHDVAGTSYDGTVASVLPLADPATGMRTVVVEPTGDGAPPAPGLVIEGALEVDRLLDMVLVPNEALVRAEDRLVVMVAGADHRAHRTPVRVLARHGDVAAVDGDVHPGDRVVLAGAYNLPDGAGIVSEDEKGPTSTGG